MKKIILGTIIAVNTVLLLFAVKTLFTELSSPISGIAEGGSAAKAERKLAKKQKKKKTAKRQKPAPAKKSKKPHDKAAYISINSNPSGAKVFINGYFKSRTPASIKITSVTGAPKQYSIKLRREGYRDWEKMVTLTKTSTREFSVNLKKK